MVTNVCIKYTQLPSAAVAWLLHSNWLIPIFVLRGFPAINTTTRPGKRLQFAT